MGFLSIVPDPVQTNRIGPISRAAANLFGARPDERFSVAGSTQDVRQTRFLREGPDDVGFISRIGSFDVTDVFRGREARVRARRPMRGIQIKEDTYAALRIIDETGRPILQIDSSGQDDNRAGRSGLGVSFINTNFVAQSIQEERVEKNQIIETFGEPFVFFFGERPRFISVGGFLLNTVDFNWRSEWWENYEENLRGTRLVEKRAKVFLSWDDIVVVGYILNATAQDMANEPYRIPFQFTLFVTAHFNIGIRGKIPVGTVDPIDKLRATAESAEGAGPDALFSKIFPAQTRAVIASSIDSTLTPVRNALSIVQGIASRSGKVGAQLQPRDFISTAILDQPRQAEALSLLRGGARATTKFGPLRNNFDEFLNTELDALSIPKPFFGGLDTQTFIQRLVNFVPGLNSAAELNSVLNQMSRNKMGLKMVSRDDVAKGLRPFADVFNETLFGPGASSSPFLET